MVLREQNLHGCRVLVTRPVHQCAVLSDLIAAAGGEPFVLPAIEVVGMQGCENEPLPAAATAHLKVAELVVFTSVNAVEWATRGIRDLAAQLRAKQVAAIGASTASSLIGLGVNSVVRPAGRFDSDSLLSQPELSQTQVAGKVVVIIKGVGGRRELIQTLCVRGAKVAAIDVYRRQQPVAASSRSTQALERGILHAAVVTSVEAVQNLFAMLSPVQTDALRQLTFVTVSERVAVAARAEGVHALTIAAKAGDGALTAALEYWWRNRETP